MVFFFLKDISSVCFSHLILPVLFFHLLPPFLPQSQVPQVKIRDGVKPRRREASKLWLGWVRAVSCRPHLGVNHCDCGVYIPWVLRAPPLVLDLVGVVTLPARCRSLNGERSSFVNSCAKQILSESKETDNTSDLIAFKRFITDLSKEEKGFHCYTFFLNKSLFF